MSKVYQVHGKSGFQFSTMNSKWRGHALAIMFVSTLHYGKYACFGDLILMGLACSATICGSGYQTTLAHLWS